MTLSLRAQYSARTASHFTFSIPRITSFLRAYDVQNSSNLTSLNNTVQHFGRQSIWISLSSIRIPKSNPGFFTSFTLASLSEEVTIASTILYFHVILQLQAYRYTSLVVERRSSSRSIQTFLELRCSCQFLADRTALAQERRKEELGSSKSR